jgi:serine/threonine protein kinase
MAFSIWKQRRGHSSLSESYAKGIANKTKLIHKSDEQSASYPGSFQESDTFLTRTKEQLIKGSVLSGTGVYTKVYEIKGSQNHAVKVFEKGIIEKRIVLVLDQEMRKLVKLPRHPNVVKIHGFPQVVHKNSNIRDSFVMDYCRLRLSLDKVMMMDMKQRKQPDSWIPTEKKVEILLGVSKGLSFLHEHGITHGNLKPTNVLFVGNVPDMDVDWSHFVKVSDYGIEKFLIFKKNSASAESHLPLSDVVGNGKQKEYPLEWKPDADVFPFGLLVFTVALGHEPRVLDAIDAEHGFTIIERDDLDLQRWKKSFESIPTSESEVFASLIEGCLIKDSQERLHFRKVKDIVNGLHKLTANASMDNSARIHQVIELCKCNICCNCTKRIEINAGSQYVRRKACNATNCCYINQ